MKHGDEGVADDTALLLRLDDVTQCGKELFARVPEVEVFVEPQLGEQLEHLSALVLAHQAVVDMEKVQAPRSQGAADQSGGDCRVDSTRGEQEDRLVAGVLAGPRELVVQLPGGVPARLAAADLEREVGEHFGAVGRVVDLRVELQAVAPLRVRSDRGVPPPWRPLARSAVPELPKAGTQLGHRVEMAHPHLLDRPQSAEERVLADQPEVGPTPLAPAVEHRTPVVLGDLLVPEAEAEDRDVEIVDLLRVEGSSPEDERLGLPERMTPL